MSSDLALYTTYSPLNHEHLKLKQTRKEQRTVHTQRTQAVSQVELHSQTSTLGLRAAYWSSLL